MRTTYRASRKRYNPTCPTHPYVQLKLGHCQVCDRIKNEERLAKIKAQPDVREYINWDKKQSFWSPSFSPLYMVLLDRTPEYVDEKGQKTIFQFGSSTTAGSHARTVEEVRKNVAGMFKRFPEFPWNEVVIKIVNAPCVWDSSIIHEVIEVVEGPKAERRPS